MKKVMITGGAGFLGSLLIEHLLKMGYYCISIDIKPHIVTHPNLITIRADIRDKELLNTIFNQYPVEAVFHCAAILAHGHQDKSFLWESNVTGTKNLVDLAVQHDIRHVIFTSSNCLWGKNLHKPVTEMDKPCPVEIYGRSKLAAEEILLTERDKLNIIIFRCPTIIDAGRLGLLSILYEFIHEGRKVYVVGGGKNQYQFIYAQDLIHALVKSLQHTQSDVFHIGSDHVKPLVDVFNHVISLAKTGAQTAVLPKTFTLAMMKLAYYLRVSPLGPYHYKMIAEDFVFDTQKVKQALDWQPTLSNEEMLWKGYQHYVSNLGVPAQTENLSAHKTPAKMGIIRLLKWMS